MIKSGVYIIENVNTGSIYVGSAVDISERWASHRHQLKAGRHTNVHLQRSWNKHGFKSFVFRVLELTDRQNLLSVEQRWLDELWATGKLYNMCRKASSVLGLVKGPPTLEDRRKISVAKMGKRICDVGIRKLSASMIGNTNRVGCKHNDESKAKIRESWRQRLSRVSSSSKRGE